MKRREAYEYDRGVKNVAQRVKEENAHRNEENKKVILQQFQNSEDLSDQLQGLTDFIAQQTKATGVYIAKLVFPRKKIEDDSDDKAHLDEE